MPPIVFAVAGKHLTEKNTIDLLNKGKTRKVKGFKNKAGKPFSAVLGFDEAFKIKFIFEDNRKKRIGRKKTY